MKKDDDFISSLQEKLSSNEKNKLPPGFDDRFWNKFDNRFENSNSKNSKNKFLKSFWSMQFVSLPLLAIILLGIWGVNNKTQSSNENPILSNASLPEIFDEEFDAALNRDLIEGVDLDENETEEEIIPANFEEWNQLLEGVTYEAG